MGAPAHPAALVDAIFAHIATHGVNRDALAQRFGLTKQQLDSLLSGRQERFRAAKDAHARVKYGALGPVSRPSGTTVGTLVPDDAPLGATDDPVARHRALAEAEARRVQAQAQAYDYLRPVYLPPVERVPVKYAPNPCWIISSDHHWPVHDPRAEAILLQAIQALRPIGYILNGDGPDMLALSKYPKDARAGKSWSLRDEQVAAKSWWRSVYQVGQAWGIQLFETEANHSGNGRASRWRRWLDERAPEMHQLDDFEQRNSYQAYFHPHDVPVQMVEEVVLADDLRVRHGEIVRKHGGYSARAHGDKWQASVMHGHTQRSPHARG